MKKKIIVSGVNINSAGPLTIFRDCLDALEKGFNNKYEIIALVHDRELFNNKDVKFLEFPLIKRSWIARICFEYIFSYFLSKKLRPDVWFSLHDITPNVIAEKRIVYCHNALCFYQMHLADFISYPKEYLFSKFYKYLYAINIRKNDIVVTQQNWMRIEFENIFNINNVVVAHPVREVGKKIKLKNANGNSKIFFYPAYPRFFKNHDFLLNAWSRVVEKNKNFSGKLIITLNGCENSYSKKLFDKYKGVRNLEFIGPIDSKKVKEIYESAHCLIFPSKLETWGLPISEAKEYGLDIISIDLPYAREAVGSYMRSYFFEKDNIESLIKLIEYSYGELGDYSKTQPQYFEYLDGWEKLLNRILG